MNFRVHQEARAEAVGAAADYEALCHGLGAEFTTMTKEAFRQIKLTPRRFAKLESTRLSGEIRRYLLTPRFPFVIIYEVRDEVIEVLAVAHGSRMPDYWTSRRD